MGSLQDRIKSAIKRGIIYRVPGMGYETRDGHVLPPQSLRTGGRHFQSNEDYLATAKMEATRTLTLAQNRADTSILEIGCGAGRLPIGLQAIGAPIVRYTGVDVDPGRIAWCQVHLASRHPAYSFQLSRVKNARYNDSGITASSQRHEFENASYSLIYMYSVFSHMLVDDVSEYLATFKRVLVPGGRIFLTAFVEPDVPDVEENPAGYGPIPWKGPLHCVRFNREFFAGLLSKSGFSIDEFGYQKETDGQSSYYLSHADAQRQG